MPAFSYSGRNSAGEKISGQLEAESTEAAATLLMQQQVIPVDISPISLNRSILHDLKQRLRRVKVSDLDLMFFSRQMHTLLRSGIPILSALKNLAESSENTHLQETLLQIHTELGSGLELSAALRQHGDVFPPLFASIVEVGESTGQLDHSFELLASYIDKERELSNNIRSALRYPTIVIGVIGVAMFVINILVIPAFADVFNSFHTQLPFVTRVLIGVSDFTIEHGYLMLVLLLAAIYLVRSYLQTEQGRRQWHGYKIRLPLIGHIIFKAILGRFANTLAMCIKAGIPWHSTFTIVSKTTDNDVIATRILQIRDLIEQGSSITQATSESGLFPPLVLQMIQIGEQTGSLDTLIAEVGEYYEREVAYKVKTLNDALEPLLLFIVGMIVLVLALGVFMPMWSMGQAALHH
jgi:MSHA biogenesis protein MshG